MKNIVSIYLIILIGILVFNCTSETEKAEPKIMLMNFYKAYINELANTKDLKETEKHLKTIKEKYCVKSLIDSINNEFENGLDYDPFIKAQDIDSNILQTLSVTDIANSKNQYLIKYRDSFSNKEIEIYTTVIEVDGQFKIVSIK